MKGQFISKEFLCSNTIIGITNLLSCRASDLKVSPFYEKGLNYTIDCTNEFWPKNRNQSGSSSSKITSAIHQNKLFQLQFEEILENGTLSDVELNVAGRSFSGHKIILAARSKVFAAMFGHETAEKLSNKVNIQDVDPVVFQEVLRYIYTGQISEETMEKIAVGVLAVADKYMLDHLKEECEIYLTNGMSADNCAELLALSAQPHPAMHLKKFAVDYLSRHPELVMATDGWKKAKEDNLLWSCDVMFIFNLNNVIEMLCDRKCSSVVASGDK